MNDAKTQDYKMRVGNILRVFKHQYGLNVDLVSVNSQTVETEAYVIIRTILEEQNIAIEIDERVAVGKFMFVNRERAASNIL